MTVASGETTVIAKLKGTRAITAIKVKMDLPQKPNDNEVLRELALRIFWDGEDKPSVWSPLGDFFGTAVGYNKYRSLPLRKPSFPTRLRIMRTTSAPLL